MKKLIMLTAILTMIVSMMGLAEASQIASPAMITLNQGESKISDINYSDIPVYPWDTSYNVIWWLNESTSSWTDTLNPATELEAKDDDGSGFANSGVYSTKNNEIHKVTISDKPGDNNVAYYLLRTCWEAQCTQQSVTIYIHFVPEFPTVAVPIAAVLGLVYFFHSRKKEE